MAFTLPSTIQELINEILNHPPNGFSSLSALRTAAAAFDGDDGREVEFTGLERLSTAAMGAMGLGRRDGSEWA